MHNAAEALLAFLIEIALIKGLEIALEVSPCV